MLCKKKESRRIPKINVFLIILMGALLVFGCGIREVRDEAYESFASLNGKSKSDLTEDEEKQVRYAATLLAQKRRGESQPDADDYLSISSYYKAKASQLENGRELDPEEQEIDEMLNPNEENANDAEKTSVAEVADKSETAPSAPPAPTPQQIAEPEKPAKPGPLTFEDVLGTYHLKLDYFFLSPDFTCDIGEGTVKSDGDDMLTVSVPAYGQDSLKIYAKTYSGRFVSIDEDNAEMEILNSTSNGAKSDPAGEGYKVKILFTRDAIKIRSISTADGNADIQVESGVKVN